MNNLIKKTSTAGILTAAVFLLVRPAPAEFNLGSVSAGDVRAGGLQTVNMPRPKRPKAVSEEFLGMEVGITIPFKAIKKTLAGMAESKQWFSIIDPAAPILEGSGDVLRIVNIRIDHNGIILEPVLTLKPYFEGNDRFAIKIQRIELHASGSPTAGLTGIPKEVPVPDIGPSFNMKETVGDIINLMTDGITDSLNSSLVETNTPLRACDIIDFSYDKEDMTMHTHISAASIKLYLAKKLFDSRKLFGDIHMVGSSFNEKAITLKFATTN
ncbi:MAG: hypothetical protein WCW52_05165 [Elusimicrobiales bacterium]|jgi:hypothetical protein